MVHRRPHRFSSSALALVSALALASCTTSSDGPPSGTGTDLGVIDFPNSGAASAQQAFRNGVLFMHNFEYEDAASAFRAAQEADPDFALAYWGEALTYNHPIWMEQDREAAQAVLARLGATPEERAQKAGTERERAYLHAVETLYGNTASSKDKSKDERDDLYRAEMRRLAEAYGDDHEAAALYALSILGSAHEGRDFATYMRAAAVVEPVFEANPDHPGAAHYLIHSYDDPVHAPLGLPMARAYSRIAPDAGHAQHMTSHIFVALGLWDDVVAANENARDVQNARQARLGRRPVVCGHYPYWLEYGYLMQGRYQKAREVLDACLERVQSEPNASERRHFALMRARYVMDTGDFGAAGDYVMEPGERMDFEYRVVDAVAAGLAGDVERARRIHASMVAELRRLESEEAGASAILTTALGGALAMWSGDGDGAVAAVEEAARMEAALPYEFGPPAVVKPMYELLGEFLSDVGRHAEAEAAFSAQLERTPLRTTSLVGLAEAAEASGNGPVAEEARSRLARIWHNADPEVRSSGRLAAVGQASH